MNPEHIQHVKDVLQIEYYGVTLAQASIALVLVMIGTFLYSGRDQRSFLGRVFDLLVVFLCIVLLCASVAVGFYLGQRYEQPAAGAFAGLFLFWLVFHIVSRIRTAHRNERARKDLAKRLNIK